MKTGRGLCVPFAVALLAGLAVGWWTHLGSCRVTRIDLFQLLYGEDPAAERADGLRLTAEAWSPQVYEELWRIAPWREAARLQGWPVTWHAHAVLVASPSPLVSQLVSRDLPLARSEAERGILLTRLSNKADPIALRLLIENSERDGLAGRRARDALGTFAARRDQVGLIALNRLRGAPAADKSKWASVCALLAYEPAVDTLRSILGRPELSADERAALEESLARLTRVHAERQLYQKLWYGWRGPNMPSREVASY